MGETMGDGKRFLEGLILRAEDVLGKMIYKMHHTEVPLEEMVPWINSVYAFVNAWEAPLQDIKIDQLKLDAAASFNCSSTRSAEDALIEEVNQQLDGSNNQKGMRGDDDDGESVSPVDSNKQQHQQQHHQRTLGCVRRPEEAEPVFEFLERSLKDYSAGQTGIGFITNVLPGGDLFDMLNRSANDGQQTDEMLKTLQNVTVRLPLLPTRTGTVFAVELEGELFRAVHSVLPSSDMVFLKLLDTGECLAYANSMPLFELPQYYQNFPPLAIRCRLVGTNSKNIPQYLRDNMYTNMKYEIGEVDETLLHVSLKPAGCLPARQTKPENEPVREYKISEKTLTAEEHAILYEDVESTTSAIMAAIGLLPIGRHYDPKVKDSFNGTNRRVQNGAAKDPNGWTRKTHHKRKICAVLPEPSIGSEHPMIATAIVSVQEFYGQLIRSENVLALTKLQAQLNDPMRVRRYRPLDHKPYTGEHVLALSQGGWYRAKVIEYYDDDHQIDVFYVDYGTYERVAIRDLRLWDDRFALPPQAIHCRLANVRSKGAENDTDAIRVLVQAISNKPVMVRVLEFCAYWEVLVFDEQGMDIGQMLAARNMALPRQPVVNGDKNSYMPA